MENIDLTPIPYEESKLIFGGDPFSSELGRAFGYLCGTIRNTAISCWNLLSTPSESNSEWMLNVPAVYLFQ